MYEFVLTISMNRLFISKLLINHKITEQSMFNSVERDFLRWVMKKTGQSLDNQFLPYIKSLFTIV